jgi:hypothetical protein
MILSGLKTLLETGEALALDFDADTSAKAAAQ